MSYATAMHDRMLACLVIPCSVVAVDLAAARVRVSDGDWTSAWVRWHSQAAGKARHWRAPSLGEQGVLLSPSGEPAQGTFVPGLYGNAGSAPDDRDHVEVWRFADGGSLSYDWQAGRYDIQLPTGNARVQVGTSTLLVSDNAISLDASAITLTGKVMVNGPLLVSGDINGGGRIIDTAGNTANHKH
ncbi:MULTISPECIES: phage baseplate assembly protein V [unclassified Pseudomonas]|uniref:phage baseplate assembly protein V n=1 Tax=unclassified Pseudomonas TaxID=196821 RepID=UPI000C884B17|nr:MULTISPECIES: phage baseplate assembly protein V [unclassified Pseudomonas]PNA02884.1 phage baseplate assembly protein V [Pseudomonas sp. FW305-42]PNA27614.1 phage baseplate assembly protein V [Pseudomonas sp. MPR-R1B]PNB29668.1 phage baseplate assembly protein V [Pseudomonas sp. DP16D-E2]PNB45224.1 phage baseplate assembly protein V [Pseudomonas sp. FW305-17]PNB63593.1 phage baseplate assembly protein V [Pseudomonas sp. GW531-E2]